MPSLNFQIPLVLELSLTIYFHDKLGLQTINSLISKLPCMNGLKIVLAIHIAVDLRKMGHNDISRFVVVMVHHRVNFQPEKHSGISNNSKYWKMIWNNSNFFISLSNQNVGLLKS